MKIVDLYKIAFLGDNDHGDKIISTLESWGGSNHLKRDGKCQDVAYFINDNGEIDIISTNKLLTVYHYFLSWPYYNSQCHLKVGDSFNYGGQEYDVDSILYNRNEKCIVYKLKAFGFGVEYITNDDLIQNEEWPTEVESTGFMQMGKTVAVCFNKENYETEVELQLGDYEIEVRDGKTYAVLKKSKYPTNYNECCEVLVGRKPKPHEISFDKMELCLVDLDNTQNIDFQAPHLFQFNSLFRLRMCLDAYWKIAGEEMGLGKPWEPNWTTFEGMPAIFRFRYNIVCDSVKNQHCLLVFPTEEMRDAFYENFKDLIEQCKELL